MPDLVSSPIAAFISGLRIASNRSLISLMIGLRIGRHAIITKGRMTAAISGIAIAVMMPMMNPVFIVSWTPSAIDDDAPSRRHSCSDSSCDAPAVAVSSSRTGAAAASAAVAAPSRSVHAVMVAEARGERGSRRVAAARRRRFCSGGSVAAWRRGGDASGRSGRSHGASAERRAT